MKSLLFAAVVAGSCSFVASAEAAGTNPRPVISSQVNPAPYYRPYGGPLPYRVYTPVYRPYLQNGRQGGGYTWGFPWRGIGY